METHDYGTGNATILTYPNTTDQCTCKKQDIKSDFTDVSLDTVPEETISNKQKDIYRYEENDSCLPSPVFRTPVRKKDFINLRAKTVRSPNRSRSSECISLKD
ncbi:hypothetical protein CEXT_434011 [Caerostris extrusa]|uniref:Uncharacterized protein n=1 Tax=Caerostris extrusa TaxID=172846 RepID=A0AAV4Y165_CAEEX|nr:hypothetical protein CEXT_434011 [Caerostris extrusa]